MQAHDTPAPSDCEFYHTMDIPGRGTVKGYWDLRGRESEYLGNVPLRGKRVLEIGPASGCLTIFMERQGAQVISLETSEDHPWEFFWNLTEGVPADLASKTAKHREHMLAIRKGYGLCRSAFSSKADVHFANAYDLPGSFGEIDIAVIASVLLHNKNPLRIVEQCARLARETVVIAEPYDARLGHLPCMNFLPRSNLRAWDTWWSFSPALFVQVLGSMGFTESRVSLYGQKWEDRTIDYFTVVASKPRESERSAESRRLAGEVDVKIDCATDRLRFSANDMTCLHVKVRNSGCEALPTAPPFPVNLSYHWRRATGELAVWDGVRTPLPWALGSGEVTVVPVSVCAPSKPGDYTLELTLVQEEVGWLDDKSPHLPLRISGRII